MFEWIGLIAMGITVICVIVYDIRRDRELIRMLKDIDDKMGK